MGKGDRKTARGKRIMGSSGVTRHKKKLSFVASDAVEKVVIKKEKKEVVSKPVAKKAAPKKPAAKKS